MTSIIKELREIKAIEATVSGEKYYFCMRLYERQKEILKRLGVENQSNICRKSMSLENRRTSDSGYLRTKGGKVR